MTDRPGDDAGRPDPARPGGSTDGEDDADLDALLADAGTAARRASGAIAGITLLVLHGVVGWFTLSLGLVAPPWAVGLLLAVWAAVGVAAWRMRARRPIVTMLVPFAVTALVVTVLSLGDAYLGWTA